MTNTTNEKSAVAKIDRAELVKSVADFLSQHITVKTNQKGTSQYFGLDGEYVAMEFGGLTGTLSFSWYGLKPAPNEAATAERLTTQVRKLSPEARRKMAEELLNGLE